MLICYCVFLFVADIVVVVRYVFIFAVLCNAAVSISVASPIVFCVFSQI